MTTGRSPNYPSIPLREAIERIRPLYQAIHTRVADREIIAQNLGYKGLNGRSLTMIASLVSYGLLLKEGKGRLRVSDRTVSIMELSRGNPERADAVRESSFAPPVFAQLDEDFGDGAVRDEALKHYLVKKGFLPAAAEEIIRVYRDNLDLVQEEVRAYDAPLTPQPTPKSPSREDLTRALNSKTLAAVQMAAEPREQLVLKISRDTEAQIFFSGAVTQEAIDKLSELLLLQKDGFPTLAELQLLDDYAAGKITLNPGDDAP